ncbi:DMT family transporter [Halorubrum luteum]
MKTVDIGWSADRAGAALVLVSAVGFGTLGIFGLYAQEAGIAIPTLLMYRFLAAALLLWGVLAWRGELHLLRGRTLLVAIGLGTFGYATMSGLYFLGLEFMTAGMVAIVLYTYPAFVVVLAAVGIGESIGGRTVLALALTLGGIVLVVGADPAGASVVGVVILLGAALAYATYIVVSRAVLDSVDPLTLAAHVLPASGLAFAAIATVTGDLVVPAGPSAWAILAGIAVVATALPVYAFFTGLERIGASRAGILSTVEPPVTVFLGALLFAEPVTGFTLAGGALVLGGVIVVQSG